MRAFSAKKSGRSFATILKLKPPTPQALFWAVTAVILDRHGAWEASWNLVLGCLLILFQKASQSL